MRSFTKTIFTVGLLCAVALPTEAHAADPFATDIAAGDYHSCMVTSCGGVQCWGRNTYGQSDDQTAPGPIMMWGVAPYESVSVGQYHSCALDGNGHLDCWGRSNYGQASPPAGTFKQFDSGANHNCAIDSGDNIVCWGADDQGQVSDAPSGAFEQVSAGRLHSCAVSKEVPGQPSQTVCWGSDSHGQAHDHLPIDNAVLLWAATGERIVEVTAGGYHTCAHSDRWQTYCWGRDVNGATGQALGTVPTADPTVLVWPVSRPLDMSSGTWGSCMVWQPSGVPSNGEDLVCWGWPFDTTYPAPSDTPQQVSVGMNHACFIDDTDMVQCWGSVADNKLAVPELTACPSLEPIDPFPLPLPWPW